MLLLIISRRTAGSANNDTFYRGERRSPWWAVAFGMVGASLSGVTFVSVPGMVRTADMTYLQMCLGFIPGYALVAFILLPVYYRLRLTSIYTYLNERFGRTSYHTGASFFLLSKLLGAAVRLYLVCAILQRMVFDALGLPFALSVLLLLALIWLYTRRGGIGTIVWTDCAQTVVLLLALVLILAAVLTTEGWGIGDAIAQIHSSKMSRIFVFDDVSSRQYFWKQFVSGAFIVVVMTGLDQDMMQKNLTCKNLREAQKDMCTYGVAFVPANLLFLSLGVLLTLWYQQHGLSLPSAGDELLPQYIALTSHLSIVTSVLFVLGIVAASFSSADSALTSLTTIYCVDICERPADETLRKRIHLMMCVVFVLFILIFKAVNSTSLIDAVYIVVSYTYGPLLGLFAFGLLTKGAVNDRLVPYVAIVSPLLCYAVDWTAGELTGYRFGYELLMLNGVLTFSGLWLTHRRQL